MQEMNGAIFKETIRQTWLQAILWGLGFGLLGASTLAVLPDAEGLKAMADLIEQLPSFMISLIGSGNDLVFMSTPEGYITAGFYGRLLLLLAIFPVLLGLRVTSNEENSGVMDTLLSLPVSRPVMMIEKILAYWLMMALMLLVMNGWLVAANMAFEVGIDNARLFLVGGALFPSILFIFGLTVLFSALIRQRRTAIIGVVVVILGGFLIDMLVGLAESALSKGDFLESTFLETAKFFSIYHYYNSAVIFQQGLIWNHVLIMLIAGCLAGIAGIWLFNRRDLA
jgi:ABC-2 type transport system permease protein